MPLKCNISFQGAELKDCIVTVKSYEGDGNKFAFLVYFETEGSQHPFMKKSYRCDYVSGCIMEQSYAYLKALPEFADAVDYQP